MQNNKPTNDEDLNPGTSKAPINKPNVQHKSLTDQDENNPDGGVPVPRAPNDPEPQESWPARQARHARENEKAAGAGKPEPFPHD